MNSLFVFSFVCVFCTFLIYYCPLLLCECSSLYVTGHLAVDSAHSGTRTELVVVVVVVVVNYFYSLFLCVFYVFL